MLRDIAGDGAAVIRTDMFCTVTATSMVEMILCRPSRQTPRPWVVMKIARCCKCAGDLPDVSKCFFRQGSHPGGLSTVHGVVFDIFGLGSVWRQSVSVSASLQLRRTPRFALTAPARLRHA
ncbi:hypothetical protein [Bradyrhizobium sp.]|uniref:hypothetical protein n=1 Tax=Bradyrhizobium sp. TaxID=376 RepID=UPI00272FC4FD|nr:hypothetical protein [Bradyrhizobium sp.]